MRREGEDIVNRSVTTIQKRRLFTFLNPGLDDKLMPRRIMQRSDTATSSRRNVYRTYYEFNLSLKCSYLLLRSIFTVDMSSGLCIYLTAFEQPTSTIVMPHLSVHAPLSDSGETLPRHDE